MATVTIHHSTNLESLECGSCGIPFAIPRWMLEQRKNTGEFFYCPNGDNIRYHESDSSRLKRRLATLEDEADELRERNAEWKRKEAAARGQATRTRNRAKAGVCQFCNRTFQNVSRHMKTKHDRGVSRETPG